MTAKKSKSKSATRRAGDQFGEVLDQPLTPKTAYPWDVWADGKPRRLTKGQHFNCSIESFVSACHQRGRHLRKLGKTVQVSCHVEDDTHIKIQFLYT